MSSGCCHPKSLWLLLSRLQGAPGLLKPIQPTTFSIFYPGFVASWGQKTRGADLFLPNSASQTSVKFAVNLSKLRPRVKIFFDLFSGVPEDGTVITYPLVDGYKMASAA